MPAAAPPHWLPPVRLRHLVWLGALFGLMGDGIPRARAAWDIHSMAASLGDYAACMAGPTGPEAIRDDPAAFRRLLRRRLVASPADEAPFARCAVLGRKLTGESETERLHALSASSFAEYGPASAAPGVTLGALGVGVEPIERRAEEAWPFISGGYAELVRPSLGAHEAMHPVAPARPGIGRGLPAERAQLKTGWRDAEGLWLATGQGANRLWYTSTDGGVSFRRTAPAEHDEGPGVRCGTQASDRGFSLNSTHDGSLQVTSFVSEQEPVTVEAVRGEHQLLAAACDAQGLVLAVRTDAANAASLVLCGYRASCVPLSVPKRAPFTPLTSPDFDVARVAGATVIAVAQGGIVRVVSSRDDGHSWTPVTVAFDAAEYPEVRADVAAPNRLVTIGSRLLLFGARSRSALTYPLLASDDQGASFAALAAREAAPAVPESPKLVARVPALR